MVQLAAFMVATTAMVLGIKALDVASAEQIQQNLELADVIPASESVSSAWELPQNLKDMLISRREDIRAAMESSGIVSIQVIGG